MTAANLRGLAEEQAALRRVATLVARAIPEEELFAAVTEEVGRVLLVDVAALARYESDNTLTTLAIWGARGGTFPAVGRRHTLGGQNTSTLVLKTGRPARLDAYPAASDSIAAVISGVGVRSSVGAPIHVEGRLWGVIHAASTREQPLPSDAETRLASFTELVATAIANAASRTALARLVEEQAALRRVATLVARGASPEQVFASVTTEVGQLLPVDFADLSRYEPDGTVTILATWGITRAVLPSGARLRLGGKNLSTVVAETGASARIESYADASGPIGAAVRQAGVRTVVGTPIIVDGLLWGMAAAGSRMDKPLPVDAEARLASFTELLATAVANAESRGELSRLAEEQAALRRVATLVARGVPPEEVFAAVTEEVVRLLPVDFAHMGRYESDAVVTILAASGSTAADFPVGRGWGLGGKNVATIVFETGRPGRLDDYDHAHGVLGLTGRELGMRSSAGTPIVVESKVWGVIVAGSTASESLPTGIEGRLGSFTELVATAVANAESRAALDASRARIVAAADESRRRIERDLHDGAQQQLLHAVIVQKLALQALAQGQGNAGELMAEALRYTEQANAELRELAHGILPAALIRGGLRAGVEALVSRAPLPVSVDVAGERLPAGVEATAYFVVSEALTNVVKHAQAAGARVTVRVERGELRVEVRDDGVGGARSGHGTGLGGLEDRVSALDGRLVLESPPSGGTRVCALLPIPSDG